MKKMHTVVGRVFGVALLSTFVFAGAASAQTGRATFVKFDGAVRLPNTVLDAGTYRFDLLARSASQDIVAIYDSHNDFVTIARVMPAVRADAGPSLVIMSHSPRVAPQLAAIYFAGSHSGYEFVYPRPSGTLLAKKTR